MYNEEQKLKFLKTIESESSNKAIVHMFNRFEDLEVERQTDIADWQLNQIYNAIEELYIFDFGTMKQYLSTLTAYKRYVDNYCRPINNRAKVLSPKLDISNIYIADKIKRIFIKDPFDLKRTIESVIDPSQGYYICAAVCFAWLGIPTKTMPLISDSSVNFYVRSIVDSECGINIQDIPFEIMDVLKKYWDADEAIRVHHAPCRVYPVYNGKFLHIMSGQNSKKQVKPINYTSIRNEFAQLANKIRPDDGTPSRLEYPNIMRSGGLYRVRQLEEKGVDVFVGASDDLLLQAYAAPGKTFDIRSLYRQYKLAFNLD